MEQKNLIEQAASYEGKKGVSIMFEGRRKHLAEQLKKENMDMVLITTPSNLYYYTGFTGGEAFFVMTSFCQEGYVITDSRYYEQVEKECPTLTLLKLENMGYAETVKSLAEEVIKQEDSAEDTDNQNRINVAVEDVCNQNMVNAAVENNSNQNMVNVAIEDVMEVSQYLKLCDVCKNCRFEISGRWIDEARQVKDQEELIKLEKAEAIGDAAFSHILDFIKPGVSEREIALELEFFMKKQGASALSFNTIVASGEHSSMPHARVTERKVQMGDFITMDFGCVYQGYCSDMTRTVAVGKLSEEQKKVYQIVLDANKLAIEGICEKVACNEIDKIARDYIKKQGYGPYFGHGLGHGVGLDIHEEPRFSPKCEVLTRENMVITVEPGIYLPGRFGVRIEDLVIVKKDGCKNLTHSDKNLIIL